MGHLLHPVLLALPPPRRRFRPLCLLRRPPLPHEPCRLVSTCRHCHQPCEAPLAWLALPAVRLAPVHVPPPRQALPVAQGMRGHALPLVLAYREHPLPLPLPLPARRLQATPASSAQQQRQQQRHSRVTGTMPLHSLAAAAPRPLLARLQARGLGAHLRLFRQQLRQPLSPPLAAAALVV